MYVARRSEGLEPIPPSHMIPKSHHPLLNCDDRIIQLGFLHWNVHDFSHHNHSNSNCSSSCLRNTASYWKSSKLLRIFSNPNIYFSIDNCSWYTSYYKWLMLIIILFTCLGIFDESSLQTCPANLHMPHFLQCFQVCFTHLPHRLQCLYNPPFWKWK